MTNSGMPMLTTAASENDGVVHTGTASCRLKPLKSSSPSAPASVLPTSSALSTA